MQSAINIAFGKRIAEIRKKQGLSQEELAFQCGLHRTYVGAIERGEKSPTIETIQKISQGLNISISILCEKI
ncbi:MAG: helix-turn-helix transcriptional regulator [Paludibacteraceae bacterium]|nr:helix-turn-helix transcriptional regulator [Paludibacteraceae bacterium]